MSDIPPSTSVSGEPERCVVLACWSGFLVACDSWPKERGESGSGRLERLVMLPLLRAATVKQGGWNMLCCS